MPAFNIVVFAGDCCGPEVRFKLLALSVLENYHTDLGQRRCHEADTIRRLLQKR
jgi:hypothetical protein